MEEPDNYQTLKDELLNRGPRPGAITDTSEIIALAGVVIADRVEMVVHMLDHLLQKDAELGQNVIALAIKVQSLADQIGAARTRELEAAVLAGARRIVELENKVAKLGTPPAPHAHD